MWLVVVLKRSNTLFTVPLSLRSLIGKLLIGYLDTSRASDDGSEDDEKPSYLPNAMTKDGFAIPAPRK